MTCDCLQTPSGISIYHAGPPLSQGKLPAFFYFSISGEESLTLPPYNTPVELLKMTSLRVFSLTLPFHGEGYDKFHAMKEWLKAFNSQDNFLGPFLEAANEALEWLVETEIVDENAIAVGGLSRGGFIATHFAASNSRIKTVLGFAPLTRLQELQGFASFQKETLEPLVEPSNLVAIIPSLLHVQNFRFYMGNHDTCVGTDACYDFIRKYVLKAYEERARHCKIELYITPSIGRDGHGTSLSTFQEGSLWIKKHLLNE